MLYKFKDERVTIKIMSNSKNTLWSNGNNIDIYKTLLQIESGRGEKVAWIFRWALYSLAFSLAAFIYFFQNGISGLFGMILSGSTLLYNLVITYFIRKKLFYRWIRYTSATIDVLALTLYNAFDTFFHKPLVPVTTATILVYPCIIFLASLRLDRRLIVFSTLLTVLSMNMLYAFAYPYFDPVITKELSSSDIYGQAYRTIYILLCGFLMLFIPGTVERLLRNQREVYEKSISNYELAHKDKLTGLGNRILLEEHLMKIHETAVISNLKYAVIFIDLDGFKEVNDEYGHEVGDKVLSTIAQKISSLTRGNDIVCRIGGDEFVIVINDVVEVSSVQGLGLRILESLKKPLEIMDNSILMGASMGIAIFPDNGSSWEKIIKAADETMYKVKKSGKNAIALCEN